MAQPLAGLIAAAFTPLRADGTLNLDCVGPMTERLIREGVAAISPAEARAKARR